MLFDKQLSTLLCFTLGKHGRVGANDFPDTMTAIGEAAFANAGLTGLELPKGCISIGDSAFENCSYLTNITLPDGLVQIGDRAFAGCYKLEHVKISEGLAHIGDDVFEACFALREVYLPDSLTTFPDTNIFSNVLNAYDYATDTMVRNEHFAVRCNPGSAAETYCIKYGIPFATP